MAARPLEGATLNALTHQGRLDLIVWHLLNLLWDGAQALVGEAPAAFEASEAGEAWFHDKRDIREFVQAMEAGAGRVRVLPS
jgi:hypothetical protein